MPRLAEVSDMNGEVIPQIYRDAVRGATSAAKRAKLARGVATLKEMGYRFQCFHGFPREMVKAWPGLQKLAEDAGVMPLAAWGLDGERDEDGTALTGKEKGECMGEVLADSRCVAGLADAEGRNDTHTGPDDVTDEDDVVSMGEAMRAYAPDALVGDQSWFAIQSHGGLRKKAPVGDPQNIFAGFPIDEFAWKIVNWKQFRQAYCEEAGFKAKWGTRRQVEVFAWMDRDWETLRIPFQKAGLHYSPGVSLQTYGWEDIPHRLVWVLITYCVQLNEPVIGWSDPFPSDLFNRCVQAMRFLRDRGFAVHGRTPEEAVKAYQTDYNKTAPVNKKLVVDGACGYKTLDTMPWIKK